MDCRAQDWSGQGWTFWQWTDCVSVPGLAHCADGDRMNGASPASLAIAPYSQDAPTLSTQPSIVGSPEAGKLLSAVPGVWNGGKPLAFTFQWRRCDAAGGSCADISGAARPVKIKRLAVFPRGSDQGFAVKALAAAEQIRAATGVDLSEVARRIGGSTPAPKLPKAST